VHFGGKKKINILYKFSVLLPLAKPINSLEILKCGAAQLEKNKFQQIEIFPME